MRSLLWKYIFMLTVLVYHVSADPDDDFLPKSGDEEHNDSGAGDASRSGLDDIPEEPRLAKPGKVSSAYRRPFRCYKSPDRGACSGSYIRYYYNFVTDTCLMFFWSGCTKKYEYGESTNRFLTRYECIKTCKVW